MKFILKFLLNNRFLGINHNFKQEVCRETWYLKKGTKYSQKHIKESLMKSNSFDDRLSVILFSSYGDIRKLFYDTHYLDDLFYQNSHKIEYKVFLTFLESKLKDQNIFSRFFNKLLFGNFDDKNFGLFKFLKKINCYYVS